MEYVQAEAHYQTAELLTENALATPQTFVLGNNLVDQSDGFNDVDYVFPRDDLYMEIVSKGAPAISEIKDDLKMLSQSANNTKILLSAKNFAKDALVIINNDSKDKEEESEEGRRTLYF